MPIYEYRCENGHLFEVMQRITDDPVTACETCEAPVQRVFHPIAVHFKGSGFYNTDYGTSKRKREEAAKSAGEKKDGGGSDGAKGSSGDGGGAAGSSSPGGSSTPGSAD
jgi:putative FmdB family regulatory protein